MNGRGGLNFGSAGGGLNKSLPPLCFNFSKFRHMFSLLGGVCSIHLALGFDAPLIYPECPLEEMDQLPISQKKTSTAEASSE